MRQSLQGVWRLANLDRSGYAMLDVSAKGYWQSFFAAAIGLPFLVIYVYCERITYSSYDLADELYEAIDRGLGLMRASEYLLQWPLIAISTLLILRWLRLDRHYAPVLIGYNWSQVVAMTMQLPMIGLMAAGWLSGDKLSLAFLATNALVVIYQWYVITVALEEDSGKRRGGTAFAIVAANLVVAEFLNRSLASLFHTPYGV